MLIYILKIQNCESDYVFDFQSFTRVCNYVQTILHAHLLYTLHGFVKQLEKFSF